MNYCEDCGAPLSPGVLFCENCGAKIQENNADDICSKEASKVINAETGTETGIVYTNSSLLAAQTGLSKDSVLSMINQFITDARGRGVQYELCDVCENFKDAGKVEKHIEIISKIAAKTNIDYLFIIGSGSVIPSTVWKNEACDYESDTDVSSDLCYASLNLKSPFSGVKYDFSRTLKVGRLPNCDFARYFENLKKGSGKIEETKSFGMSAKVWQAETRDIYSHICQTSSVVTSPECTKKSAAGLIPTDTNLFLFNLHGSNQTEYWYGQEETSYPEAIEPSTFAGIKNPYFLAVEACYGAFYEGRSKVKSVLLSALSGMCISFLGSSRIAFGTPKAPGFCADVICDSWLQNLKAGQTAGKSLEDARKNLMKDKSPEAIKTLAEFSLYGDPSARMKMGDSAAGAKALNQVQGDSGSQGDVKKTASLVDLPDIHIAVRREIAAVDNKIKVSIEELVYRQFKELIGIKPVYYKTHGSDDMNAVFSGKNAIGAKIVNVHFTASGEVKGMLESK